MCACNLGTCLFDSLWILKLRDVILLGIFLGPWWTSKYVPQKQCDGCLCSKISSYCHGLGGGSLFLGETTSQPKSSMKLRASNIENWLLEDDPFPVVSSILVFTKNWSIPGSAKLHVFPAQTDQMRSVSENIIFGQLVPVAERRSFWGAEWKMQNIWVSCKEGRMHATWSTWPILKIIYIYIRMFVERTYIIYLNDKNK